MTKKRSGGNLKKNFCGPGSYSRGTTENAIIIAFDFAIEDCSFHFLHLYALVNSYVGSDFVDKLCTN